MKLSMPSSASLLSFGKHVVSYSMGAVTMAAGVHLISGDQAQTIGGAIQQIANGVSSLVGGVSTLIAVGSGLWAAYRVSRAAQVATVAAVPGTTVVVDPNKAPADLIEAAIDPNKPGVVTTQQAAVKLAPKLQQTASAGKVL